MDKLKIVVSDASVLMESDKFHHVEANLATGFLVVSFDVYLYQLDR